MPADGSGFCVFHRETDPPAAPPTERPGVEIGAEPVLEDDDVGVDVSIRTEFE